MSRAAVGAGGRHCWGARKGPCDQLVLGTVECGPGRIIEKSHPGPLGYRGHIPAESQTLPRGAAAVWGVGGEHEAWPLAWKTGEGSPSSDGEAELQVFKSPCRAGAKGRIFWVPSPSLAPQGSRPPCWARGVASRSQVLVVGSLPFSIAHVPLRLTDPHALPRGLSVQRPFYEEQPPACGLSLAVTIL